MLTKSTTTRRALAALVAVAALLGGACGGSGDDDVFTDVFARAAETTGAAETMRTELVVRFVDVPGADGLEMVTVAEGNAAGTLARGTTSQLGQEIEYLVVDDAYYYATPDLPEGKSWVRMTFEDLKEISGLDVGAATEQSPTETLARLRASGDIEEVGSEEIDGVQTTHYRAIVRLDDMNEQAGVISDELLEQMRGLLGDSYETDIWIDDEGYMRRMVYAVDLSEAPDPPAGMPAEGHITYEMTMSDFDAPIDVVAPPESEVVDFSELN